MLEIRDLHVEVDGQPILKGLNLTVGAGEVHAIMGPNGSGKSTLSKVLCGHEDYEVTSGEVLLDGENILDMAVDARSRAGLFLAFQYPHEIPGVSNANFLRAALKARLPKGEDIDAVRFYKQLYARMDQLEMDRSFTSRSVNEGFSGGERKRNELLQLALLRPRLALLDEIDSGLDVDGVRAVLALVQPLRAQGTAFIVVSHYLQLIEQLQPDAVLRLDQGCIAQSGGLELAREIARTGFGPKATAPSNAPTAAAHTVEA